MNFIETLKSAQLVLATGEVPLIVGQSGIGKTALAKKLAKVNGDHLVVIDGNLLKEGEIGGLPTVETYETQATDGRLYSQKRTVYAVHHKLVEIDEAIAEGKEVLLFIDEINRCEHTVQQELMNLILNREINGYKLQEQVKLIAAMNPPSKYGTSLDYQVVDMDPAQENRFVWLFMEPDAVQWLQWATEEGLEEDIIAFIATFPEYLHQYNEEDLHATPRSYERLSKVYRLYKLQKDTIPRSLLKNVIKGNVGSMIAEVFMGFIEHVPEALICYEDVFVGEELKEEVIRKISGESHTRLYMSATNIFKRLEKERLMDEPESKIERLIAFLSCYPVDLRIGMMKELKQSYPDLYECALVQEQFLELYFAAYSMIKE
ncbi:MAG: ATP-binding protein [Cellulosilyticaceae bacterium]